MSQNKTQPTQASIEKFLQRIEPPPRRQDTIMLFDLMKSWIHMPARMWGDSMIGFGRYHYKYESGREGDWFITGLSPRKQNLTVYIMPGFKRYEELMKQLGKYKTGASCLYIQKLSDIDLSVLQQLVQESVKHMQETYATWDV